LLLAATVRSFAHMPLGISDRNNIIQKNLNAIILFGVCYSDLTVYIAYVQEYCFKLRISSPQAATFPHGILTQTACKESTGLCYLALPLGMQNQSIGLALYIFLILLLLSGSCIAFNTITKYRVIDSKRKILICLYLIREY